MKAVIYQNYGSPEVLKIVEKDKPVPKDNEILIKIIATTVHIGDVKMRMAKPFLVRLFNGLFKPQRVQTLGLELSGVVESMGDKVRKFKIGETVYAFTGFGFGAYAEYKCMEEDGKAKNGVVVNKPENLSHEKAATIPSGGITALNTLNRAKIKKGDKVLIYGASGSVGSFAVQIAKSWGAVVTAVCSAKNMALIKSLGADYVLDYRSENFELEPKKYDVFFDAVDKMNKSEAKKSIKKGGIYLNVSKDSRSDIGKMDLIYLKDLVEKGELKPLIDKQYALNQIVEAHTYVEKGHKKGNVVISMHPSD